MPIQPGLNPRTVQAKIAFSPLDFESQKLKAVRDMHNPGFFPIELNAKLFENLCCSRQGLVRLGSCSTSHHPVVCVFRGIVSTDFSAS
jgi:hypothetical protein